MLTYTVQKRYPIALADSSWDNTGLLVDSCQDVSNAEAADARVLLTVDLTQDVAAEAIAHKVDIVVAYHPFIFRGLKSITQKDPQQRSLLRLIHSGISVYSPHTAVDSAQNGVNDFLARGIAKGHGIQTCLPITPLDSFEGAGMGRLLTFAEPVKLDSLVLNAKHCLQLPHVQVGLARGAQRDHAIRTVAICAGSGGLVFSGVKADLFFTGEMSHHESLHFTESGLCLIVCGHSNTERPFLQQMRDEILADLPGTMVKVSDTDHDPLETW